MMSILRQKKVIVLVVLVIVAVVLGGVVFAITKQKQEKPAPQKQAAEPATEEVTEPEEPQQDDLDEADPAIALAMSNHNDEGQFLIVDDQAYYSDFGDDGRALLVRSGIDGSRKTTVREDCNANYMTVYKDRLYMVDWSRDEGPVLCSMDLDGGNYKKLVEGATDLQVEGGKLYYNKADTSNDNEVTNGGYYTSELDGNGESQLLDKETYDNFVVDGKIYYQDEDDGQTIHVMDLDTQEDKKITKTHSHGFVVDGNTAYYIDTGEDSDVTTGNLTEMDLDTGETKVIAGEAYKDVLVVRADTILYCDGENNYHLSLMDKGESGKREIANINNPDYVYSTEEAILFYDYDYNWRYVEGVYSCSADGGDPKRLDE